MISEIKITAASSNDVPSMLVLSYQKRRAYEKAQPQFWRYAGEQAEEAQAKWFQGLLKRKDHILLVAKSSNEIVGFIIGQLKNAPEVYNPGGLTLFIDDFCVQNNEWNIIGNSLIKHIKEQAKERGASQILVVCGVHDKPKQTFLNHLNLAVASEWHVGVIP